MPELIQAAQGVECAGIDAFRERILDEIPRDLEQASVMRIGAAQALERAEIVGVAELISEFFEDRPIALSSFLTELCGEVPMEIGLDCVVLEQRVVDVE